MPALPSQVNSALAAGVARLDLAQTEATIIRPLLNTLGWKSDAKSVKGQLDLRLGGVTVAFCHMLPWNEPLDVAEEQSDAVHDLLAELAKQMIELNKRKQAEVKRFLGWLETELEITTDKDGRNGIDSLANKTTLQNHLGDYQKNEEAQPWESFFAVLYKPQNRTRFVNDYWLSEMFRPQLKAEYEKSLATLLPIKERLARTDALIDQIVYQLYGLTLADIAVVEGR